MSRGSRAKGKRRDRQRASADMSAFLRERIEDRSAARFERVFGTEQGTGDGGDHEATDQPVDPEGGGGGGDEETEPRSGDWLRAAVTAQQQTIQLNTARHLVAPEQRIKTREITK